MSLSGNFSNTAKKVPLVIIVTRIGTTNEWVNWGFDEEARIAFVRKAVPRVRTQEELSGINIGARVDQDDAWVINGKYFWRQATFELLGEVEWQIISRERRGVVKYIHVGTNESLEDTHRRSKKVTLSNLSSEEKKRNARAFLETPAPNVYSLEGADDISRVERSRVADFARAVRFEKAQNEYENALSALHLWGVRKRLSMLKHRLSHLFLPLSVDLQGWKESGFSEEYAEEIADEYDDERIEAVLTEAREILYGSGGSPLDNTIEKVVDDAQVLLDAKARRASENEWEKVQSMLPPPNDDRELRGSDDNGEPRHTLELIAQLLTDENESRSRLKKNLLGEGSYQEWFANLEKTLDELRNRLSTS